MWPVIPLLIGGLILLYLGGEGLVRGGSTLALRMGVTPLVVGLTVISFGTSSPEFVVSVLAAFREDSSIALGNVIGSNICNIGLVLGLAALIRPLQVRVAVIRRETPIMLGATGLLCVLLWNARLSRVEGALLCVLLLVYVVYTVIASRRETAGRAGRDDVERPAGLSLLTVLIGVVLLAAGAQLFVRGAVTVAEVFGVSTFLVGLTIVALGTSLPEVATSMVAAYRGEGDLAIGNVIGSNIFNVLGILGIAALFFGIQGQGLSWVDMTVLLGFSVLMLPFLRTGFVLSRREGAVLVLFYVLYMTYLVHRG